MDKTAEIQNEFQAAWEHFSAELRQHGGKIDSLDSPNAQKILTTVARMPPALSAKILEFQEDVRRLDPRQYFYPVTDIHLTVLNCAAFLKNPDILDEADIQRVARELGEVFSSVQSFPVQVKGVGVLPARVFVQIFDSSGTIAALRQKIRQKLSNQAWHPEAENKLLMPNPILVWANVVRMRQLVSPEFVDLISKYREAEFGSFEVQEIELAITDKLLSKSNTTVRQRYNINIASPKE